MSEKGAVDVLQQGITEPTERSDGSCKIDKIIYYPDKKLGSGCMGTMVFRGEFQKRSIAVKRLMKESWSAADKEAANLRGADDQENVLRYYATEQCSRYIYLALQLCEANLEQFIDGNYTNPQVKILEILKQALQGVCYLHNLPKPIVHRDIKPSNVLIYIPNGHSGPRGMIADLGLSKQLRQYRQTFSLSTSSSTVINHFH